MACFTSIFIFAILLPKLDKIWISQNIHNVINKDNNRFKSENIAAIGYNEPSLIFLLGTKTNILRGFKEDFFEKRIYKYIIVEEKYLDDFNNFLKDSKNKYVILDKIEGFNMVRGRWLNTIIFKLKAE